MQKNVKIWYLGEAYQSHYRTARMYKMLLTPDYIMDAAPESCDLVVLHTQPWDYEKLYARYPWLRSRYVVSYCTWEASELPAAYIRSLALVQEVWTCSTYCADIIRKHHLSTYVIPHVVERDTRFTRNDEYLIKRLLGYDPTLKYFLNFGDTFGSRKNTNGLVSAFERARSEMPAARLVVIGAPEYPWLSTTDDHIIHLPLRFSDAQINALYSLATAYVSPHHSEGWGLTLSDAMLFAKPVIATGHSGNLDFMSDNNAYLLAADEVYIAEDELYNLFTTNMKWFTPHMDHLITTLLGMYKDSDGLSVQGKTAAALLLKDRFSRHLIRDELNARIGAIGL